MIGQGASEVNNPGKMVQRHWRADGPAKNDDIFEEVAHGFYGSTFILRLGTGRITHIDSSWTSIFQAEQSQERRSTRWIGRSMDHSTWIRVI